MINDMAHYWHTLVYFFVEANKKHSIFAERKSKLNKYGNTRK